MKTQSFRFRGGVVRIAAWHGRPDVASLAVRGRAALAPASIERLLDRVRASGYREVVTNALAPAATLPLVDAGFAVRGRLRILEHDLSSLPPPTRRTRRAVRAERPRLLEIDRAAFDEFWHLDDDALRQAARARRARICASPRASARSDTGCSAGPPPTATCNGSQSTPRRTGAASVARSSSTACTGCATAARCGHS